MRCVSPSASLDNHMDYSKVDLNALLQGIVNVYLSHNLNKIQFL